MITVTVRRLAVASVGSVFLANLTDILSFSVGYSKLGSSRASFKFRLTHSEALLFYGNDNVLDVRVFAKGILVWRGRTEGVKLQNNILELNCLGYFRVFSDNVLLNPWSMSDYSRFVPFNARLSSLANNTPEKYNTNSDNRVYGSLKKNESYANVADILRFGYKPFLRAGRGFVGFQFSYRYQLPTNWSFRVDTVNEALSTPTNLFVEAGTGALISRAACVFPASNASLAFIIFNNTGALYTNALESNIWFFEITNFRAVTTVARAVQTTLTAGPAAGANVLISVVSTANMYVGQSIVMNSQANPSEMTSVLSIVSATQFRADLANAYAIGNTVRGLGVYPDEIVASVAGFGGSDNVLSSSTVEISQNTLDLRNYHNYGVVREKPLKELTAIGDNASPPNKWAIYVDNNLRLNYKPISQVSIKVWYLYLAELDIQKLLETYASATVTYFKTTDGNQNRTNAALDTTAEAVYGVRRLVTNSFDTTSEPEANSIRDLLLSDKKVASAQTGLKLDRLTDNTGARANIFDIKPYDTCYIANLPVSTSPTIAKIRQFVLAEVEINEKGDLRLIPDLPIPALEFLLTRRSYGY